MMALRHRGLFLMVVMGVFVLSIQGMGLVPKIFIAPSQDPVFTGKLELPLGTSIERSEEVIAAVDDFINRNYYRPGQGDPVMANWMVFIGDGGPRFTLTLDPPNPNPANSFLVANTFDGGKVEEVISALENFVVTEFPDLAVQLARLENGPPVGYPIQVRLSGRDFNSLYRIADQVTSHLYQTTGVTSVKNSWGLQTKKLLVEVNQERARRAGVTSEDVAYSLRTSLAGIELTQYREEDKLIPVKLRTVQLIVKMSASLTE
ncbi:MAG: efflux RND transporter permease subunit [Pseudomonadales bacterium]